MVAPLLLPRVNWSFIASKAMALLGETLCVMAAGALLVKEAGGKLSDFSGDHFSIYQKEIVASNGLVHDEMIGVLKRVEVI